MKPEDAYLKFVRWSDEDQLYVGYCPDLFPWGGVCHSPVEQEAYATLCDLVEQEIASISVNPDVAVRTTLHLLELERA